MLMKYKLNMQKEIQITKITMKERILNIKHQLYKIKKFK